MATIPGSPAKQHLVHSGIMVRIGNCRYQQCTGVSKRSSYRLWSAALHYLTATNKEKEKNIFSYSYLNETMGLFLWQKTK